MAVSNRAQLLEAFGLVGADATVDLPSKGEIYPAYDSGEFVTSVQVRGLTLGEVESLTKGKLRLALCDVISQATIPPSHGWPNGVTNRQFTEQLSDGDLLTLAMTVRACTFGREIDGQAFCGECGHSFEAMVDITEGVEVKEMSQRPVQPGTSKFEICDPKLFAGNKVCLHILNQVEYSTISHRRESLEKKGIPLDLSESQDNWAAMIDSIGGEKDKSTIRFMLSKLPADMGLRLGEAIDRINDFGIDKDKITTKCTKCGAQAHVLIPLPRLLFAK